MKERRPISLGERWRREATRSVDDGLLEKTLLALQAARHPSVRVRPGSIHTEMEGTMGSINEVSIHVPTLPTKIWPQVAHVMQRSPSMIEALGHGRVPRSFDRLVARIAGETAFPEARKVTSACTCGDPDRPCRHILALHEIFARRLEEKPWELLVVRGVNLPDLLERARSGDGSGEHPELAFGAPEEPVLYPEGEDGDLDSVLTVGQSIDLLGEAAPSIADAVIGAVRSYADAAIEEEESEEEA